MRSCPLSGDAWWLCVGWWMETDGWLVVVVVIFIWWNYREMVDDYTSQRLILQTVECAAEPDLNETVLALYQRTLLSVFILFSGRRARSFLTWLKSQLQEKTNIASCWLHWHVPMTQKQLWYLCVWPDQADLVLVVPLTTCHHDSEITHHRSWDYAAAGTRGTRRWLRRLQERPVDESVVAVLEDVWRREVGAEQK